MTTYLQPLSTTTQPAGLRDSAHDDVASLVREGVPLVPATAETVSAWTRAREASKHVQAPDAFVLASLGPAILPVDSQDLARLYVDQVRGSDDHDGLADVRPMRSLPCAVARASRAFAALQDCDVEVVLSAGVHQVQRAMPLVPPRRGRKLRITGAAPGSTLASGTVAADSTSAVITIGGADPAGTHVGRVLQVAGDPARRAMVRASGAGVVVLETFCRDVGLDVEGDGFDEEGDPLAPETWQMLAPSTTISVAGGDAELLDDLTTLAVVIAPEVRVVAAI